MQSVCPEVRFCEKSRGKRSFWKLGLSLFVEVSWEMLVLEAWGVIFGESLVENAWFRSLDCHFWWKSRGKCSFWKLGVSFLVKVSWKMLVLEAWIVTFGESLVENACLGSLSSKSVQQECLASVSCQECPAGVSSKSVKEMSSKSVYKKCHARVRSKSVQKKCQARLYSKCQERVSSKTAQQECLAGVSCSRSVKQECQERVSSKSVLSRVSSKSVKQVSSKSVQQECQERMSSKACQERMSSKECQERASRKNV